MDFMLGWGLPKSHTRCQMLTPIDEASTVRFVGNSRAQSLTQAIKAKAHELGFDAVGVAAAANADPEGHFAEWLTRGYDAGMDYMARTKDERIDPSRLVPDARTVIALQSPTTHLRLTPPTKVRFRSLVTQDSMTTIRSLEKRFESCENTSLPWSQTQLFIQR